MSLLDRIRSCTAHAPATVRPWRIGGTVVGWVNPDVAALFDRLAAPVLPDGAGWRLDDGPNGSGAVDGIEARAAALESVTDRLIDAGLVRKRRNERYPVLAEWDT